VEWIGGLGSKINEVEQSGGVVEGVGGVGAGGLLVSPAELQGHGMGGVSGEFAGDPRCHLHCGEGQVADVSYEAAKKVGRRRKKNSRLRSGPVSSGGAPRNAKTTITKDLTSIAEENVDINTIVSTVVSTDRDVGA